MPGDYTPGYGTSIAVQGNTIVVGGPGSDNRYTGEGVPGAPYVFTRTGTIWSQTAKIVGGQGVGFGYKLDLDGNWLVASLQRVGLDLSKMPNPPEGVVLVRAGDQLMPAQSRAANW